MAMALPISLSVSSPYPITPRKLRSKPLLHSPPNSLPLTPLRTTTTTGRRRRRNHYSFIRAIERKGREENISDSETLTTLQQSEETAARDDDEASKLGSGEMRKAVKGEREGGKGVIGGDLWGGVAEEIGEIEWPVFGKVLGTTGVVLGIIAGSSVVLLTLNAVLAELSDRVFVGKGVQDFFG